MARRGDKERQRKIARERIEILFSEAGEAASRGDYLQASRLVGLARAVAMKFNVRILREFKRLYCKYCYVYRSPTNSRSRTNSGMHRVEVECLECGRKTYYPYAREAKMKRARKKDD